MKNILITGSKGQLGSELQRLFSAFSEFTFFPTDIDTLDLTNKQQIENYINQADIHYIINCAAYTAVDKAEDDIENCYKVNREAVKNIAESACGKAKVIHVSTDYVFDGTNTYPYKESDATNPQSVYGKSKKEGEEMLLSICPESIIIRTSWLYSSFGNNFVKTMLRLAKEKSELNIVSDQRGTPTYAADLAFAILSIISFSEKKNNYPAGIYHYSNEGDTSWFDFTRKIMEIAGIKSCQINSIPTNAYPTKATRPMYSVLDKTKIKKTFSLTIPTWEESLKVCLNNLLLTANS
ncbi:dTDP-4-dehydrorhamnose reductase [Bacteroidales bacterium OttesenSCG-928-M06]|nr:dTDP-4-dehydrorhamnose reductase [Bacteroidales bacterium OttesenSCG-928-M06]